jgi:hypothetical protein
MHEIEPYYRWRDDYIASEDALSPFFETKYNEFELNEGLYISIFTSEYEYASPQYLVILDKDSCLAPS